MIEIDCGCETDYDPLRLAFTHCLNIPYRKGAQVDHTVMIMIKLLYKAAVSSSAAHAALKLKSPIN